MYTFSPYLLFGISFVFLCLFFFSYAKQRNRLAGLFSLMCISMTIYVFGYAMELLSTDAEQIKFFITVEYFGFSFIPVLAFMLAYKFYFNRDLSLRLGIIISIIPFLTPLFNATNDFHHLFYKNFSTIEHKGFIVANYTKGIWHNIFSFYSYAILLVGIYIFFAAWRKTHYCMRNQRFWLLIGSVAPLLASTYYLVRPTDYGFDPIPFSMFFLSIAFAIAIFKYEFLELKEIVRGYAFGQIKEGIMVLDDENRIIDFNNSGELTFEWLNFNNIGKSILEFEEGKKILENISEFYEVEIKKRGEAKVYEFKVTPLREKGKIVGKVFLFQDITEQKLAIDRLNYIATHDTLSELYNRNKLMEEIEKALYLTKLNGEDFSILMLDIDYFKQVNDNHGHIVGDMVIKRVAHACKEILRAGDIIGRYGGEEFVVILPETDKKNAVNVAEKLRKHIADMDMKFMGKSITITVSIGVASVSSEDKGVTSQELMNRADMALYVAKNSGRNTVGNL